MMNRLADLALLMAVLVIAVVAVSPMGQPVRDSAAQSGPGETQTQPPTRRPPDAGRDRDRFWRDALPDRPLPRFPRNRPAEELTDELIDACIEVAHDIDPELAKRLTAQRSEDPTKLEHLLRQRGHRLLDLAALKDSDPNLYDLKLIELNLDSQISDSAAQLKTARAEGDTAQVQLLEDSLRAHLRLQLVFALQSREDYICRLQEHIERLESELAYDRAHFDERVEMKFQQLIAPDPVVTSSPSEIRRTSPPGTGAAQEPIR